MLSDFGYETYVDPMLTGGWGGFETSFFEFLNARSLETYTPNIKNAALFLDPDTGVSKRPSSQHTTIYQMTQNFTRFPIVFSFDQSFSRGRSARDQIQEKLYTAEALGAFAFFYDSHARFLFLTSSPELRKGLIDAILAKGLPASRLVSL